MEVQEIVKHYNDTLFDAIIQSILCNDEKDFMVKKKPLVCLHHFLRCS